ncbi:MAG: hypothetical protein JST54_08935 [Deltaproteobacteria bacterium]|nr:hypothetical protein [Deltaproteobacteria bacterium]
MKRPLTTLLAAALGLAACATTSSQPVEGSQFDLSSRGGSMSASCSGASCTGPQISVRAEGNQVRGLLGNQAVNVTTSDKEVKGSVGSEPVQLQVRPQVDGLSINGTFAGQLGSLQVADQYIQGRVGRCSYDLKAEGPNRYRGNRSCGGLPQPTFVTLPSNLAEKPQGQRAALLAMLLSG